MIDKSATILKLVPFKSKYALYTTVYRLQAKNIHSKNIEEPIICINLYLFVFCIYLNYFYDWILCEFVYSILNILWI